MSTTRVLGDPVRLPRTSPLQPDRSHRCAPRLRWPVVFYHPPGAGRLFELYDLFQTGYISTGLLAKDIFHTGEQGIFVVSDQAAFASSTFMGLFVRQPAAPLADKLGLRDVYVCPRLVGVFR